MNRIDETFQALQGKRAALMPYLPLGYPTLPISRELIRAAEDAGADILELGVPFSDPLADGPVIQHATQVALENGMTLHKCIEMVQDARAHGVRIPLVLMGYYNPILRYDLKKFARDALEGGVDGVIVPDLPIEEADDLQDAARAHNLNVIFLAAPTSSQERLKKIGRETRGFLYLVSLTGTTGQRDALPPGLEEFVRRAREATSKPVCVGFGIGSTDSARRVAQIADGVIVGSALVAKIGDASSAVENARQFISELREATATAQLKNAPDS
ncbi:MAG: tryptophan synthase subunit alpha [Anaerolineae bacterium]|nr:tryptophan synthase subunit alpha [Anaerolineae bacterium]